MLSLLLWGCSAKVPLQKQYTNPMSLYVDEVEEVKEGELLVILGMENRSNQQITIEKVSLDVSGYAASMDFQMELPEDSRNQVRFSVPVDPNLDRVRVIGMVSSLGEEYIAVCDRTIDLAGLDHHH